MITTSNVIILRCVDYQESSRIITVLSEAHGKIALMARGVKKPKNKLAGAIEIGNILEATYYYKASRNVQTLSEASIKYQSLNFRKDFDRASILYSVLELISFLTHENEENIEIMNFAVSFIMWLGELEEVPETVLPYVQLRLALLSGFALIDESNDSDETVFLNISSGTLANQPDSELAYKLSQNQSEFLTKASASKSKEILNIKLAEPERKQLIHHLDVYFKYHIEGFKDRRSDSVFEQMIKE